VKVTKAIKMDYRTFNLPNYVNSSSKTGVLQDVITDVPITIGGNNLNSTETISDQCAF